jgi:hypothetical protein
MTARLDVQTRDGVMLLTIDNPAQRNALIPDISRAATVERFGVLNGLVRSIHQFPK